jgi:hypothetical protein
MDANKEYDCHFKRVYAVKFDKNDVNILVSGGWDKTVKVKFPFDFEIWF